jgi:tRNA threonylcarbamoyladenosine biosynthesis protein TsaE
MTAGAPSALDLELPDAAATSRAGQLLAPCLRAPLCIWLCGELGAGKTSLARALLRAFGWIGAVRSPTYTLLEAYLLEPFDGSAEHLVDPLSAESAGRSLAKVEANSRFMLYHSDLYRMASPNEWIEAGFEDLDPPAFWLVEWPERGGSRVPAADLRLELRVAGGGRRLRVIAASRAGEETCRRLESVLQQQPVAVSLAWSRAC